MGPLGLRLLSGTAFLALVFAFHMNIFPTLAQETASSSEPAAETSPAQDEPAKQQTERQELENLLATYEKEIEETQKTIEDVGKQKKTLQSEISSLNAKISKLNLQIKSVSLQLTGLNQDINDTQKKINFSEDRISYHKDALAQSIRMLYEADNQSIFEILLSNNRLSDFFANLNNVSLVQDNLRVALAEIIKLRGELVAEKEELSLEKEDTENLKAIQQSQKKSIENTQDQKSDLLKITRGKEAEYQKLLQKTKETAAEIRSRIFQLLGGGELTFEAAYDYAKLAEGATGVRASLILAILHRESLLGKNVGRCSYVKAMHPRRDIPIFLDLLQRLNLDPDSTTVYVSCANSDGAYGGAMGPAQFIPSTWKLYESKISTITNNNPPNPWNNADAFAATAVYMRDLINSAGCQNYGEENKSVASKQTLVERCAAAKYYAGSRWYTYRFFYGDAVVVQAAKFQKDIEILNS